MRTREVASTVIPMPIIHLTSIDPDGRTPEEKAPDKRDQQIAEQLRKEHERTNPGGWDVGSKDGEGGSSVAALPKGKLVHRALVPHTARDIWIL